jgi:hypothetical protein
VVGLDQPKSSGDFYFRAKSLDQFTHRANVPGSVVVNQPSPSSAPFRPCLHGKGPAELSKRQDSSTKRHFINQLLLKPHRTNSGYFIQLNVHIGLSVDY